VVEDFAPFREFICSTLRKQPSLQIIGEVSDGLEAVRKAEELQPDLILLDVGLPTLNGIEAARRIRKISPESKIVFVSQESSADFVREALRIGAMGYVVKTDAGCELLTAVSTVLRGETFASSRLANRDFTTGSPPRTPESPLQEAHREIAHRHEVRFYSDDACFLDSFTEFVGAALKAGSAVIVVATESHRDNLLPRLHAHGLDIGAAIEEGRYISLDAADTLATFMVNDLPDPCKFVKIVSDLILEAAKVVKVEHGRVAACGECAPLLWAQGKAEAAIRLEHLWDEIAQSHAVDILCGYPLGSFQGGVATHTFEKICAAHSAVHPR
jgi:DNA-binding NarL/FixJ family response regulator